MAMLPQSSVGQMDREIETRPSAERQSQLLVPKYLIHNIFPLADSSPKTVN